MGARPLEHHHGRLCSIFGRSSSIHSTIKYRLFVHNTLRYASHARQTPIAITAYTKQFSDLLHSERLALPQVGHQPLYVTHKLAKHPLLLLRRPVDALLRRRRLSVPCRRGRRRSWRGPDGWRLGHQVKVQELKDLNLDLAGRVASLEQGGDGRQSVQRFKNLRQSACFAVVGMVRYSCVGGVVDERAHQGKERGRLNGAGVARIEQVEHHIHVYLTRKELSRLRVEKDHPLDEIQRGQDQHVVLVVCAR